MSSFTRCPACAGPTPLTASACPHCQVQLTGRSLLKRAVTVAGSGLASLTLMACYGSAPCNGTKGCVDVEPTPAGLLPDGGDAGVEPTYQYCRPTADSGVVPCWPDGGAVQFNDAGSTDGGQTDGGTADAGPKDGG